MSTAFHPAVNHWFAATHGNPSPPQRRGWPAIASGEHTLIAAPTGTGKTLAGFLAAIDGLVREAMEHPLPNEVRVLYISPLKALGNDIARNLQQPLEGIAQSLEELELPTVHLQTAVRSGDTPASQRQALLKRPPHILVTTPESLYILLTSEGGRNALRTVRTVIVDEIHALLPSRRGAHLSLSLERLAELAECPIQRIGLSATQKPLSEVAQFLVGTQTTPAGSPACRVIDCGHTRKMEVGLQLPDSPLDAVMSAEVWSELYDKLADLIREHTTTLVFVGNRRMAERLCRHLAERLDDPELDTAAPSCVAAHHGSLAKEIRLSAEQRLKNGQLRALVATASLELGIDIGSVDLVCQIGSPRSIASMLQRVGRAGHHKEGIPRGLIFPLTRNDLLECSALLHCVQAKQLDATVAARAPLDILAQQIVACAACEDWPAARLLQLVRRSHCYRDLPSTAFDAVVAMLCQGFNTQRGRRAALITRDPITEKIHGRKAARLTAMTSGGAIADAADYRVVLEPDEIHIGSIGEDFAVEAMAGDIFQLGNASWRIVKVETGLVRVADAQGQPPTIPFWLGEAPARSDELSAAVSAIKERFAEQLAAGALAQYSDALSQSLGPVAAKQLLDYLGAAEQCLGILPTQNTVVVERFFDEAQNTHVVIHSSFGVRTNRAWGLSLRKRFCRNFNFELQAAATEDAILLSLGPTHSFELSTIAQYLHPNTVCEVLQQAVLDSPIFEVRWRHNTTRSLANPRFGGGKKVPAYLSRIRADDLLAVAFPDQQACLENIVGERQIPDHPLVTQTLDDCLNEAMDCQALVTLLRRRADGELHFVFLDVTEPSPLAHEILNANPYAFLDPAPLEERRTQAVHTRRFGDPGPLGELSQLSPQAIATVREQAWPTADGPDEVYDALTLAGFMTEAEYTAHCESAPFESLQSQGRAARVHATGLPSLLVGAEFLPAARTLLGAHFHDLSASPPLQLPPALEVTMTPEAAAASLLKARLQCLGPVTEGQLLQPFAIDSAPSPAALESVLRQALIQLQTEGCIMSGHYLPGSTQRQWCDRALLARIHRYTLQHLRREIESVDCACFMRFLFAWQKVAPDVRGEGRESLAEVVEQLEGFEAAAGAWESALLMARLRSYNPHQLDELCHSGSTVWARLFARTNSRSARMMNTTPIVLCRRENFEWLARNRKATPIEDLGADAQQLYAFADQRGASFLQQLQGALPTRAQLEGALSQLVAAGQLHSDGFGGVRGLLSNGSRKNRPGRRARPAAVSELQSAGRWTVVEAAAPQPPALAASGNAPGPTTAEDCERWARLLLRRYGVVCRAVLERENAPPWRELLPPLRRLEARGEVRGGRFVARLSGEQFALPEAIAPLRKCRKTHEAGQVLCVSACDPLNLAGSVIPGRKISASPGNWLLFRDGVLLATQESGQIHFHRTLPSPEQHQVAARLRLGLRDEMRSA